MPTPQEYIQTNRAALFDWLVLSAGFLLGFVFPSLSALIQSMVFYNLMLIALLLYTAGALLKHLPLSSRITRQKKTFQPVSYVIFLVIGHFLIIFLLVVLAEPAFWRFFGLASRSSAGSGNSGFLFMAAGIAAVVTWLVYRNKTKLPNAGKYSSTRLFRQELAADILLVAGVSLISFVFWEKGAMGMLSRSNKQTIGDIWFLFLFLAILFLFFYLPLRYLFFIENREGGANRKRLFLIFGFLLVKALFEMLHI